MTDASGIHRTRRTAHRGAAGLVALLLLLLACSAPGGAAVPEATQPAAFAWTDAFRSDGSRSDERSIGETGIGETVIGELGSGEPGGDRSGAGYPDREDADVLEFGPPTAPPTTAVPLPAPEPAVPEWADRPRLGIERLRAEAGGLTRSGARADGSHYLHGTVAAEWPINAQWSARLAARVDSYIQTGDTDFERTEADYGESFLRYRDPSRRVTLGAQTVVWGRVDELPPTDRLSVQDISRYVLDDVEDRRRAVAAVRWEEFIGEYQADLLYIPFFRAAELPPEDSIWSPVDRRRGRIIGQPEDPLLAPLVRDGHFIADDGGRGGWGVRLSRTGRAFDHAITLQDARQSLPYYVLDPRVRAALLADPTDIPSALAASPTTFEARHPRTWVVGGDVGFATERSTWRIEAAWLSDQPATTDDLRLITLEAVEWVVGTEFFPGDREVRMNLHLAGRHLLDAPQALLDRENVFSVFGDVEASFARDRWRARLRFFQGLDEGDTYLNPRISFLGWEPHELSLGYYYFGGEERALNGFHSDHDLVTLGWTVQY